MQKAISCEPAKECAYGEAGIYIIIQIFCACYAEKLLNSISVDCSCCHKNASYLQQPEEVTQQLVGRMTPALHPTTC